MEHTKGEWKVSPMRNIINEDGAMICATQSNYDEETELANAKLIAAAPNMIDALIKIQSFLKSEWPEFEYNDFLTECVDIDSLIKKATL